MFVFVPIIFALFFVIPAHAKFELCNETSYVLDASIAERVKKHWQTRGWFRLYPGFCETVIKNRLQQKNYYVHARSAIQHSGAVKLFGGTKIFCVSATRNRFLIKDRVFCREKNGEKTGFAHIAINQQSWTQLFQETTPFHTRNHAMVAGVQRLLKETGFEIGDVDGYWGKRTRKLIMAFQRSIQVRTTGIINQTLFDRLLKKAGKKLGVQSGFKLCNQTDYQIWAAVGYRGTGYRALGNKNDFETPHFESKGWLQIRPKSCAMLLREKLGQPRYYLYAEAVDRSGAVVQKISGDPIIWFGDFPMCLRRLQFKIEGREQCVERGFQIAPFRRIETKGQPGWTEYLKIEEGAS